jgi:hypothetical protein
MISRHEMAIRRPVAEVVDAILRGLDAPPETRMRDENGDIIVRAAPPIPAPPEHNEYPRGERFRAGGDRRHSNNRNGRGARGGREPRTRQFERDAAERDDEPFPRVRPAGSTRIMGRTTANSAANAMPGVLPVHGEMNEISAFDETPREETNVAISTEAPVDVSRVRAMYPFGISRSRLARAIKQLGLPLAIARRWQDADAVLLLVGSTGLPEDSSFLREARELGLPLIGVRGNTYAQILARLNALYGEADGPSSPRELAIKEAQDAAQRVLEHAAPVELRPQIKPLRRVQHQMAEKFHLRSYSVGREPNRRVRFLPRLAR